MRVGIQPFTIRTINEPLPSKLQRVARAGYEGVELGVEDAGDAVADALAETDLGVASVSANLADLERDPTGAVEACEALGCERVLITWLGEDHWESRDAVEDTAATLDGLADDLAERGLELHYHNHDHEFTDLGETTGYEHFVDATDAVNLELDLGWAGTAGADPVALLDRIGERVSLVHVKDMAFADGEFVTFGEGDLDVAAAVETARDNDVAWLIFENDEPTDPVAEPAHASLLLDRYTDHYC